MPSTLQKSAMTWLLDSVGSSRAATITSIMFLLSLLSACTSLGSHNMESLGQIDFGPRQTLRICVYRDANISRAQARQVIDAVDAEFDQYALDISVPWIRIWQRFNNSEVAVIDELTPLTLEPPCDRLLGLDSRHAGRAKWLVVLQESLGAVELITRTRGYILYTAALRGKSGDDPKQVAIHEAYHLLGCDHDNDMTSCYRKIADLKSFARSNMKSKDDFFPGISISGELITSRKETDRLLRLSLESSYANAERSKIPEVTEPIKPTN